MALYSVFICAARDVPILWPSKNPSHLLFFVQIIFHVRPCLLIACSLVSCMIALVINCLLLGICHLRFSVEWVAMNGFWDSPFYQQHHGACKHHLSVYLLSDTILVKDCIRSALQPWKSPRVLYNIFLWGYINPIPVVTN